MFGIAVVGEGLDGDAATGFEQSDDLQIFRIHQFDQVFHNDVHAVFVEVAMIAEAEKVKFQALALHHQCTRNVVDNEVSKVGLTCLGAQGGELRTIHSHKVLVLRMFVLKRLQHLGCIVIAVLCVLVAQQRNTFQFLFVSRHKSLFWLQN